MSSKVYPGLALVCPGLQPPMLPSAVLDVLHHQHTEGRVRPIFCDRCWNATMTNEIRATVLIKILNVPGVRIKCVYIPLCHQSSALQARMARPALLRVIVKAFCACVFYS